MENIKPPVALSLPGFSYWDVHVSAICSTIVYQSFLINHNYEK